MARRVRPKNIKSKAEMIAYLEGNLEYEFPFVEEAWIKAEESYNNDTKPNKRTISARYFQLMGLEQYKKIGQELRNEQYAQIRQEAEEAIIDDLLDEESEEGLFIRELISIYFANVKDPEDLQFVVDRLSDYYNNYEFNEGSDKFLVVSAVADELALRELYKQRVRGADFEKRIKDTRASYMGTLSGLKLLKSDKKEDGGKNKFTAFVDELSKTGELNFKAPDYPNDQIDDLIEATRRSVAGAYHG